MKIPILKQFDFNKCIGYLEIYEEELPCIPAFNFSIAYKLNNSTKGYELLAVSIETDIVYQQDVPKI